MELPGESVAAADKGQTQDLKTSFLVAEAWMLAWAASVQRANIYRREINQNSKELKSFRQAVAAYVADELLPMYEEVCDPDQHRKNLEALAAYATAAGRAVLTPGGYKLGVAQKFLNLLLKYHWCLDLIAEPPHCPIDRIVIEMTPFRGKLNWTEITAVEQYTTLIEAIGRIAKDNGLSIATWELKNYSRR